MKSYRLHVSLIFLVALFFIVYPLQTTYAYFTDQTAINGNLTLTTGTLSLAEIAANSQTFKTETEYTISTMIQNTGSLAGKLTIPTITATQKGQVINYQDYFTVQTAFSSQSIGAGGGQRLSVTLTKKKDWAKEQPIELALAIRISQANLTQDNQGFTDEKVYKITIINDQPKDENTDWPDFPGIGYIEQQLYHSVVNGKLTTVVPGIVYLKSEQPDSERIRTFLKTAFETGGYTYNVATIEYVVNKGYRMEITHAVGKEWKLEDPQSLQLNLKWSNDFANWNAGAFSHPFIFDSEGSIDGKSTIKENFYLTNPLKPLEMKFYAFNNQKKTKTLSETARMYIKNHLTIMPTEKDRLKVMFNANFSGVILEKNEQNQTSNSRGKMQIKNGNTVVFERHIHIQNQLIHSTLESDETVESLETLEEQLLASEENIFSTSEGMEENSESTNDTSMVFSDSTETTMTVETQETSQEYPNESLEQTNQSSEISDSRSTKSTVQPSMENDLISGR